MPVLASLGADAGITHATAKSWLSLLEAGYVAWRLPPFHANVTKRLIKTPKLHFVDSGLACYLLGIRSLPGRYTYSNCTTPPHGACQGAHRWWAEPDSNR